MQNQQIEILQARNSCHPSNGHSDGYKIEDEKLTENVSQIKIIDKHLGWITVNFMDWQFQVKHQVWDILYFTGQIIDMQLG